jgi:alpha-galactosidase
MPKIALIGGGSYAWTPVIVSDMVMAPELGDSEVVLMDVVPETLKLTGPLVKLYGEKAGSKLRFRTTTSCEEALRDADYVVVTISTGGLDAMRVDIEVPEKYGIYQTVGDTVGPGGWSRCLRNVPVFLDLARKMERFCPKAWMLNCSNPLTPLTRVVNRETNIRAVGLCHGVAGFMKSLLPLLGCDSMKDIDFVSSGIDHCGWLLKLTVKGRDGFAILRERGLGPGGKAAVSIESIDQFIRLFCPRGGAVGYEGSDRGQNNTNEHIRVAFLIFAEIGYLPTIGDRHIVEFFPHFLTDLDLMKRLGIKRTSIPDRIKMREAAKARIQRVLAGKEEIKLRKSNDVVLEFILAASGKADQTIVLNVPNQGQIPNLPAGAIVDTRCCVTRGGIESLCTGPLPPVLEAIVAPHLIRQEMQIDAALNGDRQLALAALATDPLVQDMTTARRMMDEMLEGTRKYLPQFK